MSWILLTVLFVMIWGLADVISKKGTDINDEYSHVKFVICNGVVMLFALPILRLFSESGQSIIGLLAEYPVFVSFLSSTYCVFSIIFSHIFIHEKLSRAQYICIFVIIMGLMLFGISEGLA